MADVIYEAPMGAKRVFKDMGDGTHAEVVAIAGGNGEGNVDRELVVTTYFCKLAFTGASEGDTITSTQIIDVSGAPSTVSTVWRNHTTAIDLTGAPSAATLALVGSQALTDAQLRATAVSVTHLTTQRTPSFTRATSNGTIAAGAREVGFAAVSGTVTVAGSALNVGERLTFTAPAGDTLAAVVYTVTGGQLVVTEVR